ncbi:hypothetical protein HBI25_203490 [Parastagonospora nodorum]|nr:hypothetical protein HBH48_194820 [Parastagonospora nodorum]KAH4092604.1 hypothetical protein HBH46_182480 [Parastagonospora nodorum]KAH4402613.1 hypothetical protein HBH93_240850 [Parastagonospora nodorum]KAH4403399.1 hypothetical protein HBH92_201590 [Parastagonospora nodorum]KAH4484275.1 hypothetical protein HBH89_227030 [Parastagonospora nodorum]
MVEALQKWPASEEVNETDYALANNISGAMYEVFAKDIERGSRFAKGMQIFTEHPQFSISYVTDHYDWEALGQTQVVDVEGSRDQSKERTFTTCAGSCTAGLFENLLKKCDPAFVLRKAMEPGGSALGLLEFVWKGVK